MKKMSNMAWLFLLLVGFDAQAFYNPSTGRWLNRDPIEETRLFAGIRRLTQVGMALEHPSSANTHNLYHFVFNEAVSTVDALGLQTSNKVPKEGDPCGCDACEVTAEFKLVSVAPTCSGGGCRRRRANSWSATVLVDYEASGNCVILGCKYWTCNTLQPRGTATAYTSGSCNGWTYDVGGPIAADYHAKAMEGVLEYLSCENGKYVKKELSAGTLQLGFYYNPVEAYERGKRVYP